MKTDPSPAPERVWLASYPPGVPAEVDWRATPTLKHLLERSCERFADKPAFTSLGVTMSYRELEQHSRDFAAFLQHALRLAKGERVAVMLPNSLQHPVVVMGALRAGMTVVNVNPLYTAAELRHQLQDSGAAVVVVLENFAHTMQEARAGTPLRHVVVTQIGDLFPARKRWLVNFVVRRVRKAVPPFVLADAWPLRDALSRGATQKLDDVDLVSDDVAFIQYTGGTTGRPKVAILDDEGRPLPLGSIGEIGVRGPQVMRGYWNKPQETAAVITPGGWLRTGDIGRMGPDGYVEFVDRKKDIIVVSGMKAFPQEIDDAVRLHPGVEDAAAVGIPDEHSGEAVMLYVVRRDPQLTEEAVRLHCEQHLAPYKRPRYIEFRKDLPRTAIGKVLRRQLKDEAAKNATLKEAA